MQKDSTSSMLLQRVRCTSAKIREAQEVRQRLHDGNAVWRHRLYLHGTVLPTVGRSGLHVCAQRCAALLA